MALDQSAQSITLSYMRGVGETSFTQFYNVLQNLQSVTIKVIDDLNFYEQDFQDDLQQAYNQAGESILQV